VKFILDTLFVAHTHLFLYEQSVFFFSLSYIQRERERERELISLGIFNDFGFVSESGIAIGVVCYD
jgi:hypothetical protein